MSVLCLTGWQQKVDALAAIAPDAMHFDYSAYDDVKDMFAALPSTHLAIGWSLGGQLLVRAVAEGYIRPKTLLLLGTPFQAAADAHFAHGATKEQYAEIRANYAKAPEKMLKELNALIALGDTHATTIARTLNNDLAVWKNGLFWLDELARTSCRKLAYAAFPHTVIVHGLADRVIDPENAKAFAAAISGAEFMLVQGCAHAPHLHDSASFRMMAGSYV